MLVIGGGVLLLVLAGFRMYPQRKRAAARRAEDGPDGTDEDGDGDGEGSRKPTAPEARPTEESEAGSRADAPQQPSDPAPDTASEGPDPSGTGERVGRRGCRGR